MMDIDPMLKQYRGDICARMDLYEKTKAVLTKGGSISLPEASNGYLFYGFHKNK